jgi:YD repeat-containing protein
MRYFLAILVLAWLAVMPPFFTHGECDAEFDQATTELASNHLAFSSPGLASAYWQSKSVPASVFSADQCRHLVLKFIDDCGPGPLVYAAVPVKNPICRFYRDDSITVQFGYDARGQLVRVETDMKPSKSLPLPFIGKTLYWAK